MVVCIICNYMPHATCHYSWQGWGNSRVVLTFDIIFLPNKHRRSFWYNFLLTPFPSTLIFIFPQYELTTQRPNSILHDVYSIYNRITKNHTYCNMLFSGNVLRIQTENFLGYLSLISNNKLFSGLLPEKVRVGNHWAIPTE